MKLLWLSILIVFGLSQATAERKDLAAVRWPDLSKLEESVRDQVAKEQESLLKITKDPSTSAVALSEAYGKLGQIYHAYSLTPPARDCYSNANVLAPRDFRWIYLLGKLDQQEGRFVDAIRRYQAARTLRPDYVAVLVNLGNIFLELNRLDDAAESFGAALAINKNNTATHYGLGQVAMSRRRYADAVTHFETTLAQAPGANRVHYSLAMAYRGLGNAEKVKAHLAQQGPVGVRVTDPLFDGLQELIAGERVYLSRGKLAFESKRYADAAAEFRKAVAAKPDSTTACVNLGAALTQLGDLKGAAEQFEQAIRIDPAKANAHYNLAVILARQDNHAQAIDHLGSALSAEPNDLAAQFLLAHLLAGSPALELRDGARALALAQRVFETTGDPQHGALVAMALAELSRCAEAADWQRRMIVAAAQQGNKDVVTKLRVGLQLYEGTQSCRPAGTRSIVP